MSIFRSYIVQTIHVNASTYFATPILHLASEVSILALRLVPHIHVLLRDIVLPDFSIPTDL
jgi:hypothetical protein